jgi:hypothetical protein
MPGAQIFSMKETTTVSAAFVEYWALLLLARKGHRVGSTCFANGTLQFDVDDEFRTRNEIISMAQRYPEWTTLARRHEEYLRTALAA